LKNKENQTRYKATQKMSNSI